tara:strand:- start:268 stop:480 length:213 start_codon:yes stop_codon:yes gene_type:complete
MKEKYRKKGGYAKTLKRIFLNWTKKQPYKFITGHVEHGIHKKFTGNIEEVKVYDPWYDAKKPFIYYRRIL